MFDEKLVQTAKTLKDYCNTEQEAKGLDAIRGKHDWWYGQHEVHANSATGPFFYAPDTFYLVFDMDVTNKESGDRMQMQEVGRYQINAGGQIIREEFSYPPMG